MDGRLKLAINRLREQREQLEAELRQRSAIQQDYERQLAELNHKLQHKDQLLLFKEASFSEHETALHEVIASLQVVFSVWYRIFGCLTHSPSEPIC